MRAKKNKKARKFYAAVFGLVLSLLLGACSSSEGFYIEEAVNQGEQEVSKESIESPIETEVEPSEIYVQVCGAVANPGVYPLTEGSRVFEAVALAGGMLPCADMASLNQAQALEDGQMVYVYTLEEAAAQQEDVPDPSGLAENQDGKVNINKADVQELMTLPGIGTAKAESIVSWREENGAFQATEDIMRITGIKEGVFSKIKDKIKTN